MTDVIAAWCGHSYALPIPTRAPATFPRRAWSLPIWFTPAKDFVIAGRDIYGWLPSGSRANLPGGYAACARVNVSAGGWLKKSDFSENDWADNYQSSAERKSFDAGFELHRAT